MRPISLVLAALFCLWAGLAGAAIGTPTQLGVGTSSTGVINITTAADSPPGTLVVVATFGNAGSASFSATDSVSNCGGAYPAIANSAISGAAGMGVFYCSVTSDLPNGGVITVNCGCSGDVSATAFSVSGIATSSPLDQTGSITHGGTSSTSATATTTGTLSQASEIVVGVTGVGSGYTSGWTQGAGFTSIGGETGNTKNIFTAYQVVSATTSISWTSSWTGAASYQSIVFSFIGGTGAVTTDNLSLGLGF
jgi:hypothetical protein